MNGTVFVRRSVCLSVCLSDLPAAFSFCEFGAMNPVSRGYQLIAARRSAAKAGSATLSSDIKS